MFYGVSFLIHYTLPMEKITMQALQSALDSMQQAYIEKMSDFDTWSWMNEVISWNELLTKLKVPVVITEDAENWLMVECSVTIKWLNGSDANFRYIIEHYFDYERDEEGWYDAMLAIINQRKETSEYIQTNFWI